MATNPHLILCNGAAAKARRPKQWSSLRPQHLSTFGRKSNVTLKIADLTDRMVETLPPVVHDLIEFAALIYAADQACKRAGGKTVDLGEKWHRTFRFEVAVREPDFWNDDETVNALVDTLGFLSGDNYEFVFTKLQNPPSFPEYLEFNRTAGLPDPVDRVILFSGGLDSLTGAVEDVLAHGRRIAMVSHKPVDHLAVKQRNLVAEIARRANDPRLTPLHFPIKAHKTGLQNNQIDYTQRCRSFLYASMAASVAQYFGLSELHFYENGVVSVNLPLCQQELSTRATRTTHPQTLDGFGRVFSLVMGKPFEVKNEFFWDTKQDVLERLKRSGHVDLARDSLSCSHTRNFTQASPHCGECSQCVSRRIAALGAVYGDNDPASGYRSDVVLGPRKKDADRIMAERFIGSALTIEKMTTVDQFHQEFAGELGRIYPYIDLPSNEAAEKLFDLHRRHSEQAGAVMTAQMALHVDKRRLGLLPDTCMLNYAFDAARPRTSQPAEQQAIADISRDSQANGRVQLGKPGMPCFVDGKKKIALTDAQHVVVQALLKAGEEGLTKDALEGVRSGARQTLRRLKKDPDWDAVILFPGKTNGRYRALA